MTRSQQSSRLPVDRRVLPSDDEVTAKRALYAEFEPRDLAYRVARDLVERAYRGEGAYTIGDGVGILLMWWNAGFYRFRPDRLRTLVADLDGLIDSHRAPFDSYRSRSAATYDTNRDRPTVEAMYDDFQTILWPVGAAKALHVMAPTFFPIWDTAIANEFRLRLSPRDESVGSYLAWMDFARRFAAGSSLKDPLKAFDEWAYVSFTLRR